ncbi:gamma carbonic anhydrase family protein [Acuticoccus sp. I52.16.1]|uniref:gamma carbonic anhydrase family protein n=1 Tax=Acuticoccus sp. I52.16.1 TaxID=2928472 RepID=UPI001FD11BBD|nr:gamma carbonic anhydrase family protein [Acuticoccus sp. I52.16.1]UOM34149.1 gamma carbonic anhydrase family protein [Acuticoccus sp. I52.16.1]
MPLYELNGVRPTLPASGSVWIAPGAHVMGDVVLGERTGVWFGAVLRGDNTTITIGEGTNIQDHVMVHVDPGYPATLGKGCTVGHRAIIHGCTIGDNTLIGMGAIVLNGARIGNNCIIGAGALITEGKEIPDGSLVVGTPGKVIRQLDDAAAEQLKRQALSYVGNAEKFMTGLREIEMQAANRTAA